MTGWRCGWLVGPKPVIQAANALQSHETSNVNSITQKAAVAALTGPQQCVTDMLAEYQQRRDQVLGWLAEEPRLACAVPQGAFYLFPSTSRRSCRRTGAARRSSSRTRCSREEHVVTTPGEAFDAPGFIRLSYATSLDRLREGVTRLIRFARGRQSFHSSRSDRSRSDATPTSTRRLADRLRAIVGADYVRTDDEARAHVRHRRAEARRIRPTSSSCPATTAEIAAIARLCNETRTPLVPRGGGTGYTGGAVPVRGGVVLSLERMNRILEIDEGNLLAVVEPNVITGDLQDAVERVGLFYPPDPVEPAAVGRSAATSPSAPAGRARSSTASPSSTCSASRPCCRPARSSAPAARS